MAKKKIALVAFDAAPSGCFKELQPVLEVRGYEVILATAGGKDLTITPEELEATIAKAQAVVLGMSSSPELARPEIAAGRVAAANRIPYGFYGDVRNCWGRARPGATFEELALNTSFFFGLDDKDASRAGEVFPRARLFGTGNPLREKMAFPKTTRVAVRSLLGITEDEKLVLAPGSKFAAGNIASWALLMDVLGNLESLGTEKKFQLILTRHPGDKTEQKLYDEMLSFSPVAARFVSAELLTSSDLVPGADLIVEFGSSIGIEGAYQGVPVVTLAFGIHLKRWEKMQGTRKLESVDDGLSEFAAAHDGDELGRTIAYLLTPEGGAAIRKTQKEVCPKPTAPGAALSKMADAIDELLG